jgi:UDP-N-acetylglucosamine/UDP-N-acetylgalactosamine diphosphorylase
VGSKRYYEQGIELLSQGKCALLVLAGGSGSRLRFGAPKGCFIIDHVKKKSLFELLAEKVKAASLAAGYPLEMAIMTSPLNHEATLCFFREHNFFGLEREQVHFFTQKLWPLLNLRGDLFLEERDRIAEGPNGNGGALQALYESPIYARWKGQGVSIVNVVPIDNPMADPFDVELLGFHREEKNEVSIKTCLRARKNEKVGVLVLVNEKPIVVEYSEAKVMGEKVQAFIGLFCVEWGFIERAKESSLPLHAAKKAVKMLDAEERVCLPESPNAWKFELFLFDLFPHSTRTGVINYPRESCFAPLKNFEGEDSIATVRAALLKQSSTLILSKEDG